MASEDFKRKLTAIFSADVEGYSRLMGDDEDSTVRTLTAYRELMSTLIERYRGRVVDSPGDNLLAEFGSVRDAVRCAVEIQEELGIKNADLPEGRKMQFRIGINLGDVIEEGNRIYGDGINVAARVEGLADAGGICISGTVYDSIRNKLSMSYEFLGEHNVKNIKDPVRIYRIRIEPEAVAPKANVVSDMKEGPKSIAVLPFVDLSREKDQEYFVDGLSEEILNSLCQIPDLTVIARTSSFSFKGKDKTIQEIASVLGVENILEGSVRKAGNALRITSQLVKAVDGSHLWSKTYNRELKDIFAVQEDIATAVADELKVTLGVGQSVKQLGGTDNLQAYELYLVARGQFFDLEYRRALESIDAAIAIDPDFSLAWAFKTSIHMFHTVIATANRAVLEQDEALHAALRAVELEPKLANAYLSLGLSRMTRGDFIEAELAYRKSIELKIEQSELISYAVPVLYFAVGNFEKASEILEETRKDDPLNTFLRSWYVATFGLLGDMQRAEQEYERGIALFGEMQYGEVDRVITALRLGTKDVVSSDDIVSSDPISVLVTENIRSPKDAITKLCRLYTDDVNLSSFNFFYISLWAAYFGDPEFAMDALEKAFRLEASGIFHLWLPVMRKVRQSPRFKKFVREIGLVDYWNKFGWPDFCHKLDNGNIKFD